MPFSMTGMGKAVYRNDTYSIEVEIRSVNNRYLFIKSHLPDSMMEYEPRLQRIIRKQIKRGTVDLFIRFRWSSREPTYRLNRKVLAGYLEALAGIRKKIKLTDPPTPEWLSGLPGVVEHVDQPEMKPKVFARVEQTTNNAIAQLLRMRATEGKRMGRAILRCRKLVERHVLDVEKKAQKSVKNRSLRLKARVEELLEKVNLSPKDPTLQREIAVLADRADITEEIDRLKSHLQQFDRIVASDDEIGRQLDFLLQELLREANTIGSKACDADISHRVVNMKAELEKMREQVQNIE